MTASLANKLQNQNNSNKKTGMPQVMIDQKDIGFL
jgi:hypothetical protein